MIDLLLNWVIGILSRMTRTKIRYKVGNSTQSCQSYNLSLFSVIFKKAKFLSNVNVNLTEDLPPAIRWLFVFWRSLTNWIILNDFYKYVKNEYYFNQNMWCNVVSHKSEEFCIIWGFYWLKFLKISTKRSHFNPPYKKVKPQEPN